MIVADVADVTVDGQPSRMALSSMCRDGNHKTCRDLRMRCTCECHAPARSDAQPARIKTAAARANSARTRVKTRTSEPELEPKVQPAAKRSPVVALVKTDPPPLNKPPRVTLAGQIRPLLEEILVAGDRDWYRVVLFFKARQASMNLKRLRDAHSKTEWEWQARRLDQVDQSAIYVRWIGKDGRLT